MRLVLAATLLLIPLMAYAQEPAPPTSTSTTPAPARPPAPATATETVDVIAVTPLHGSGLPRTHLPANVQVIDARTAPGPVTDLGALLTQGLTTLQASEAQGGLFQPDVVFRGFSASPLLGASEGLAIYVDGVRANEPFGDVMNWDSLPPGALATVNVMPGSNPMFGLNALGGAISVRTRDGFSSRGGRLAMSAGAFGRVRGDGEVGGARGPWAGFLAGSWLDEQGWRDHSPSALRRAFGRGSWRGASTMVDVAATVASNDLSGNGTAPESLLEVDRSAVFTYPDRTDHDLVSVTGRADHLFAPTLRLEAMASVRDVRLRTLNGDAADDDAGLGEDAGLLNRSRTDSVAGSAMAQLVWTRPVKGRAQHATVGLSADLSDSGFALVSEFGTLTEDRQVIGTGVLDPEASVGLDARTRTLSVFASDTIDVTRRVHLTAAARVNWSSVVLRDRLGDDLDGDHAFARLNPAAGVTWDVTDRLNLFAGLSQASRVPTPVELTCADPDDPCRLPNAFVSDPPLDMPVARTLEAGARGHASRGSWSVAAFATQVRDDLIFVSSGRLRGTGHFENVARTRRHGIEAAGDWRIAGLTVSGSYAWQAATYGADLLVPSALHPDADGGALPVEEGDTLPGVPRHVGRAMLAARPVAALDLGVQWRAQSSQMLRGDEGNRLAPVPGFMTVDAQARWRLGRRLSLVAQLVNVFDAEYATFGTLGDAGILDEPYDDEFRFVSPGAPRAAWVGLEARF
ncbi:TonB-dependent receptor [Luteitalea sp. TBR-22]|uniref:TonB-dependent receptor n=1 Tax=Luteitalea sp. TBR-22 TaxID=2802971 RepID=UPI001AF2EC57|nr:TonB-dependent receptor [Luteitalea sp. TBR-22]BCS32493.1 TonB-dependent receptor [Luteitalea sp. TBR-22]